MSIFWVAVFGTMLATVGVAGMIAAAIVLLLTWRSPFNREEYWIASAIWIGLLLAFMGFFLFVLGAA